MHCILAVTCSQGVLVSEAIVQECHYEPKPCLVKSDISTAASFLDNAAPGSPLSAFSFASQCLNMAVLICMCMQA